MTKEEVGGSEKQGMSIIVMKNMTGYSSLCQLLSRLHIAYVQSRRSVHIVYMSVLEIYKIHTCIHVHLFFFFLVSTKVAY